MQKIVSKLHNQRLVTIVGMTGIGKTFTARMVAHYYKIRGTFEDGILYLSLKTVSSANNLLTKLLIKISNALNSDERTAIDFPVVKGG